MKFFPVLSQVVYMCRVFPMLLILMGIFGCGGDENTLKPIDADPIEKLVGTWDLTTHPSDIGDVEEVRGRLVISSDSTSRWTIWGTFTEPIESSPPIYMKMEMKFTLKGQCVVSGSSLAFIYLEDALNVELDFSFEAPGNPELQKELEEAATEFFTQEEIDEAIAEMENSISDIKVDSYTGTLDLEGNTLTLIGGFFFDGRGEYVFEKK